MYRELLPLRRALSAELKATLSPAVPGIDSEHLLQSYLDRLTIYVGCDVADQILTFFAVDTAGDEPGRRSAANDPPGFEQAWDWLEDLRSRHGLRITLLAMETMGVFYWACWDFLAQRPNLARVLYNPRTTKHMTEVLSKKVRNELVDAYALAEQVRLGSTQRSSCLRMPVCSLRGSAPAPPTSPARRRCRWRRSTPRWIPTGVAHRLLA